MSSEYEPLSRVRVSRASVIDEQGRWVGDSVTVGPIRVAPK